MDIAQAAFLVVDEVFARPVAVDAASDDYFGIFRSEGTVAVVDDDGDLGKAHRGTFLGTAENHVLHLAHAQEGSLLFAQNPTDGVGNVRLAATVRTNHGGKSLRREVNFRPLGKGLESKNL